MATPRALATIDLAAITANVKTLQARSRTQIMAVVKADAYGHGLVEVAKAAVAGGATWVGTALLEEGLALRAAGIECRVMSWLTTPDDRYDEAIAANIDLSASSIDGIKAIVAAAERLGKPARLHLEIDTGMTRGGVLGETPQSLDAIKQALKAGHIHFAGMWSHFARADEPESPVNERQRVKFEAAVSMAHERGIKPEIRHMSNSAATLMNSAARYDLVRCGIAMYGLSPDLKTIGPASRHGLKPVMKLTSQLVLVKDVPAGVDVSYGGTYTTAQATKVGIIPLGYADGVPRHGSNALYVTSSEGRHRVVGRVCMDQIVVDLGAHSRLKAGDEITCFGGSDISADDWGLWSQTIGYEIVTRLGSRIPRIYA